MTDPLDLRDVEQAIERLAAHDTGSPNLHGVLRDTVPVVKSAKALLAALRAYRKAAEAVIVWAGHAGQGFQPPPLRAALEELAVVLATVHDAGDTE